MQRRAIYLKENKKKPIIYFLDTNENDIKENKKKPIIYFLDANENDMSKQESKYANHYPGGVTSL